MSFPVAAEVAATMQAPPPEYGPSVTFGWDGPVTREALVRDFDALRERGFRIVTIEAGYDMDTTPYLSDAWFDLVAYAVGLAKERGMRVILIDEGKYPSGFAGGKFSRERPDLRMQGLAISETISVAASEHVVRNVAPHAVGVLAVNRQDGSHRRIPIAGGRLEWTAPGSGDWRLHIVDHGFRTPVTRAVNDSTRSKTTANSMGDLINPEAVAQFIAWTHEGYQRHLGRELGNTVIAFRGDEPDYAHVPFTPGIFERFRKEKGYDVAPFAAAFVSLPREENQQAPNRLALTDEERRAKSDYWDVWSRMFADVFFGLQTEWCARHRVEYTTHLNHDNAPLRLVVSSGDFFRDMKTVQIPGIDTIWNQVWPGRNADFVKFAGSAAHIFGHPRALSESYAAYNQPRPPTLSEARWGVNYQLARGITLFEFMFYPSSARRGEARFHNYMSEKGFPALADYTNRAGYVLSQGRPVAKIGLYFPTFSLWLGDSECETSLMAMANALIRSQREFDFVDEQGLATEFELRDGSFVNLSGQGYEAIIVPTTTAISRAALDRLRLFARAGGRVIFVGPAPSLVVDRTFMDATGAPDLSWALHEASAGLTSRVVQALPPPDVQIDQPAPDLAYLHRALADAELYFFFNQGEKEVVGSAVLEGQGAVQEWNLQDGSVAGVDGVTRRAGGVQVPLVLGGGEARVFVVARAPELAAKAK